MHLHHVEALERRTLLSVTAQFRPGQAELAIKGGNTDDTIIVSPALEETPIHHWNVVPHQEFASPFNVGLVAWHVRGMDRVEFSVNGGPWEPTTEMALNPQSGTVEYWTTLDPNRFITDGQIEVRAILYPAAGTPVLTESLLLVVNRGTLPNHIRYVSPDGNDENDGLTPSTPKGNVVDAIWSAQSSSSVVDGVIVYLLPGVYPFTGITGCFNTPTRWVTIAPAPGYTRDDVVWTNPTTNQRLGNVTKLRLRSITVLTSGPPAVNTLQADAKIWWDNCLITNAGGRYDPTGQQSFGSSAMWRGGKYVTDCEVSSNWDGPGGCTLVRNTQVACITQDAFSGTECVVNCTVDDVDPGEGWPPGKEPHPDIYQQRGGQTNVILYGVTTPNYDQQNGAQGIYLENNAMGNQVFTNVALVNCSLSAGGGNGRVLLWLGANTYRHIYVKDSTFRGRTNIYDPTATYQNVVFENTVFLNYDGTPGTPDLDAVNVRTDPPSSDPLSPGVLTVPYYDRAEIFLNWGAALNGALPAITQLQTRPDGVTQWTDGPIANSLFVWEGLSPVDRYIRVKYTDCAETTVYGPEVYLPMSTAPNPLRVIDFHTHQYGQGSMQLSWVVTGGWAPTEVLVQYREQGASDWIDVPQPILPATDVQCFAVLTGLTPGRPYELQVQCTDDHGKKAYSPIRIQLPT